MDNLLQLMAVLGLIFKKLQKPQMDIPIPIFYIFHAPSRSKKFQLKTQLRKPQTDIPIPIFYAFHAPSRIKKFQLTTQLMSSISNS